MTFKVSVGQYSFVVLEEQHIQVWEQNVLLQVCCICMIGAL